MTNNIETKVNNKNKNNGVKEMNNNTEQERTTPIWRTHTIYLPDLEDVEYEIGRKISNEYYDELIDDLENHMTYDDYKETFLEMVKDCDENIMNNKEVV